jgi:hypothetical protein
LTARLKLHPRSALDFFDALVALGMLEREDGVYRNTAATDTFLDRNKVTYLGGMLEMANERLYPFWGSLTEGLKTGLPQNEVKGGGAGLFESLYNDPERLRLFLRAMTGLSMGASQAIAQKFPWDKVQNSRGCRRRAGRSAGSALLETSSPYGVNFDLDVVAPIFNEYAAEKRRR